MLTVIQRVTYAKVTVNDCLCLLYTPYAADEEDQLKFVGTRSMNKKIILE